MATPVASLWAHETERKDILGYERDVSLPAYTEHGGYPLVYFDANSSILCADCATRAYTDPDEDPRMKPQDYGIHYEGPPEICEDCNLVIGSAYGDPDSDSDEE